MMHTAQDLALARRHVCEGEALVARQIALVQRFAEEGHPTGLAEELLNHFEQILREMRVHMGLIEADLGAPLGRLEEPEPMPDAAG